MPITRQQLKQGIKDIMDEHSDNPDITPAQARNAFANALGDLIADFSVGRQTIVTGTSATGGAVTGTGVIQE